MAKAMTAKPSRSLRQAAPHRKASIVAAVCALAALLPAGAQAAGATTDKALGITIPASAKVHGTDSNRDSPRHDGPDSVGPAEHDAALSDDEYLRSYGRGPTRHRGAPHNHARGRRDADGEHPDIGCHQRRRRQALRP